MAYYYQQLSKIEQKAYYAVKEGLLALSPSISVPLLDGKVLSDIYFMVRMDCPEIFWSVKFSYRYYRDSNYAELIPEYLFKKNQIADHFTQLCYLHIRIKDPASAPGLFGSRGFGTVRQGDVCTGFYGKCCHYL